MVTHRFTATCPAGVGVYLAQELTEFGAREVVERPIGVQFSGDLGLAYRICLWSRLANRVILELGSYPVKPVMNSTRPPVKLIGQPMCRRVGPSWWISRVGVATYATRNLGRSVLRTPLWTSTAPKGVLGPRRRQITRHQDSCATQ